MSSRKIYFRHSGFRKEQKEIIIDTLESLDNSQNILFHAPTGTGKTDASLSAAITYAVENNKKILFLTPKISQHRLALEVIKDLNEKYPDLELKAIDFVGKRNLCIDPGISEVTSGFYEICKNATEKGQCPFYENIKPKKKHEKEIMEHLLIKKLKSIDVIDNKEIKKIAQEFKDLSGKPKPVCAYELAKIFAKHANIIIADYYHVFSKKIANNLLPEIGIDLKETILIIDEAHNLEDRVLNLLSRSLNYNMISRAIKEANDIKAYGVKKFCEDLLSNFENIEKTKLKKDKFTTTYEEFISKEDLISKGYIDNITEIISEMQEKGLEYIEKRNESRSSLVTVSLFLEDWIINMQSHIRFIKKEFENTSIKYTALDVSLITKDVFNQTFASIIMSATLKPLEMYRDIFGLDFTTNIKEYNSPFSRQNKLDLVVNDVTTKFTQRTGDEFKKIADYITKINSKTPGNSIVFFPSFEMLKEIKKFIKINKPSFIQEENMTQEDFDLMIEDFKKEARKFGSVLYAVMGGKASEGIDLPGDLLISATIVGIPLSKMELYTKAKIDYYERKFKKGWQYAYIQPAIQKAIQSAGRVIRTEKDRGVIVYLDNRYTWPNYKRNIPKEIDLKISKNPEKDIEYFFR